MRKARLVVALSTFIVLILPAGEALARSSWS